jgi:Domain of unknown function (DUF1707)
VWPTSRHHGGVDPAPQPGPWQEPPPVRPEDLRAGDADREQVLGRLRVAKAEGRLDIDEFDERAAATLAARTYGELAALTADLPGGPPVPRPLGAPAPPPVTPPVPPPPVIPSVSPAVASRSGPESRGAAAAWAGLSVTTLVVWTVVGIATGGLGHPWWIWVVVPWGVVLSLSWLATRSSGR